MLFPSSGVRDNSPCGLGRGVLVCRSNVDVLCPHVTQTEDSKGFKVLGNFMSGRESETLINTCEAPYLHERDLSSAPFGIQGHRNASGIQELLSQAPCVIGQSIRAPRAAGGRILRYTSKLHTTTGFGVSTRKLRSDF